MKILFVGDLNDYGRSYYRYQALLDLGHVVEALSYVKVPMVPGFNKPSLLSRIFHKLKRPLDETGVNSKICALIASQDFDIVWLERGTMIKPQTLKYVKDNCRAKLISISEDDMFARHNRTVYYQAGLPYYDVVFTTKVYNLQELKDIGAKRTELFLDSYYEALHRPIDLSDADKLIYSSDVAFIGTFESERALSMLWLAEQGIKAVVWGNDWSAWKDKHENLIIKNKPVYNTDYVKAICGAKINLCFLRKINRDQVTSRSVEIPACGAFMIAERTDRHKEFFKEDEEAVFFNTNDELLKKVKYYLTKEEVRSKIARYGKLRCEQDRYGMSKQLKDIISKIYE